MTTFDETFETVESRLLAKGQIVSLEEERVRYPGGRVITIDRVIHPGAVAVVPIDRSGTIYLIRQYRHSIRRYLLEIPAGKLEPGETPEKCAIRELEEEIGYQARELRPLGEICTSPGYSNETIHLFMATELIESTPNLDPDEYLDILRVHSRKVPGLIRRGEIIDSKSICALSLALWLLPKSGF